MKNALILTCALCVLFLATGEVLAFSGGRAASGSGNDSTGSLVSSGVCIDCHDSESNDTTVTLEIFDDGTNDPAGPDLQANTDYDLRFTVNTPSGTPTEVGFQLVVLNDDLDNSNNGTIDNPNGNSAVVLLNTRRYWEHSSATATQQWTADWLSGSYTGAVTFYYTGNADDNGTAGDSKGATTPVSLRHFEVD